jgi:hypothetical protein
MPQLFYDSAFHLEDIVNDSHVMLYGDGAKTGYQLHYPQIHRFGAVRWITVLGTGSCGAADYEEGNPVYDHPGKLKQWAQYRHAHGWRARVYCDRANLSKAIRELDGTPVIWWIPTLDGNPTWTAEKLHTDILEHEKINIPVSQFWACQYRGGPAANVDTSVLLGKW